MSERLRRKHAEASVGFDALARIAHDLRAPLGVLSGVLHELREDSRGAGAEHEQLFALGERSVLRMLGLAERLGLASHLAQGDVQFDRREQHAHALVTSAIARVARIEPRLAQRIRHEPAQTDVPLHADAAMLVAALHELIENAARHAKQVVTVEVVSKGDDVMFCIADDGPSIDPEQLVRAVAEPFLAKSRARMGLGLWLANTIVDEHEGRLEFATVRPTDEGGPQGLLVRMILPRSMEAGSPR